MATGSSYNYMDSLGVSQNLMHGYPTQSQADTLMTPMNEKYYQNEIEALKTSLEMTDQANKVTQNQVGNCIHDIKNATSRIERLEKDMKLLRNYTAELEEYCISLDTTIHNHHILISGIAEYSDELVNLVAFRVLQTCYAELEISDIDYSYRIGFNPTKVSGGKKKIAQSWSNF